MFREVSYKGNLKGKELVFWDKEISAFMGRDLHRSEDSRGRYLWVMDMPENSIIIGNIYENPELLNHEEA